MEQLLSLLSGAARLLPAAFAFTLKAHPGYPVDMTRYSSLAATLTDAGRELADRPRLWPVFLSCLAAFVTIVAFSLLAVTFVRSLYPDLSERAVFEGLPGLLALTIVSFRKREL